MQVLEFFDLKVSGNWDSCELSRANHLMKRFLSSFAADLTATRIGRNLSAESVQRWKELSTLEQEARMYEEICYWIDSG
jgi:hypothetical protein